MSVSTPRVSVIVNCFNGEKYLKAAIDSVYAQTYTNWEIIFWDNASSDRSAEIVQGYDERLRYFKGEQTIPLGAARNKALEKATGELIAFLDCDDLWLFDKLNAQVPLFDDPNIGFVYSDAVYFTDAGKKWLLYGNKKLPSGKIFPQLLQRYFLCMGTVVLRKAVLDGMSEWFDNGFNLSEEADLFMRIAYKHEGTYASKPLMMYRLHQNMSSVTMKDQYPGELELLLKKITLLHPEISSLYPKEIGTLRSTIQCLFALQDLKNGKRHQARHRVRTYLVGYGNRLASMIFIFSFLPCSITNGLFKLREKWQSA